jgi:26S proteasome regulatory subunit N1
MVEICAYAGTGNVLKIQQLLHICAKHYEQEKEPEKKDKKKEEKKDEKKGGAEEDAMKEEVAQDLSGQQAVAVLGLGLIAMGEDIGSEMLYRTLGHLMRYVV